MAIKKKILITAGPTWVAIDPARVISNIASGETGFILASLFSKLGYTVTLLLGPGYFCAQKTDIKLIRFKYFWELRSLLFRELKSGKYAAIIHSAAVADYTPKRLMRHKVSSQRVNWNLSLIPTKKLIASFKTYPANLFKVGFKFEPSAVASKLLKDGRLLLNEEKLDLVVTNSGQEKTYRAYILEGVKKYGPFSNKLNMADCLSKLTQRALR